MESEAPAMPARMPPQRHRDVAHAIHRNAQRVGSGRVLTDGAHLQPKGGFVEDKAGDGHQYKRPIDQQIMIEQCLAEIGNIPQQGNFDRLKAFDGLDAAHGQLEEQGGKPQAKEL
jgi:hypothetical protein